MVTYVNKGRTLEFDLSDHGYKGFKVLCAFKPTNTEGKYELSMWLRHDACKNVFKVMGDHIDTQLVSGTRHTIQKNVATIVTQACKCRFFDKYVTKIIDMESYMLNKQREYENNCNENLAEAC